MDRIIPAASTRPATDGSPQDDQSKSPEIAKLIKSAGSPEAVIQYLLKEKQSHSQQNNQLWRLVDKQRAMILGLNKDLEAALKDKEKYRKKLKEVMAHPAVMKTTGVQNNEKDASGRLENTRPRVNVDTATRRDELAPQSPNLDSDSQKGSPIDVSLAPYPITPPADQPQVPLSVMSELLDPAHVMPRSHEHALDKFDHEAEEKEADKVWKEKNDEHLRDIPFNISLPPSRSLPSDPPKIPAPKPPTVAVVEPTPQPNEGLAKFPSPPRKAPPAPLQLKQEIRRSLVSPSVEEETDSDYDDILEVDRILPEFRGRRRTREEDDREREILAIREAEMRSASKKSKSSKPGSPSGEALPKPPAMPQNTHQDAAPASLDAVLSGMRPRELLAPLLSPGLPASPRPMGNVKMTFGAPPLSPRGQSSFASSAPLSPRPPRQPIPLPPNTPLAPPPNITLADGTPSVQQPGVVYKSVESTQHAEDTKNASSRSDRTKIYKGLVTEEHPDLLLPPNALPSIDIKVASSRMKPSRASLMSLTQLEEDPVFTLAIVSRSDGGELWRVEKDSASLAKLDQRLKQCSAFIAKTPDRSLFSGHAPAKLDARRLVLDHYLDELLNTPLDNASAVELCRYLSTNTLPPNADETGTPGRPAKTHVSKKPEFGGRPTRTGYLTKKGKNFGGWKARFFVLDGPHLKYYETPGGAHLGTIKLPNSQIGKQSQSNDNQSPTQNVNDEELDNQYRHAFLVLEPKKKDTSAFVKHVLCAESDKERDFWVEALLQWIDYRDPDDVDLQNPKAGGHDRHATAETEHQGNTSRVKKGSQPKGHHSANDPSTLIGVRYDSTHPGDAPHGVPGRPKTSSGHPEHHGFQHGTGDSISSQPKVISGPKDPQVISDAAAWGNKAGLAAPTVDEKKQRKRSFFGFGPKARSSSDGQDSLFGGSENGTPPQNAYHGPAHQVFGAPLADAVRFNPPVDVNVPLPSVVYRCIQYLEAQNAILEEGIFRLSGSNVVIKQLRERFNTESDINLVTDGHYHDIHAVASLLKLYLRELPTTILTRDLHLEFLATTEMSDRNEKFAALRELTLRLPQANATLLKYLIAFLIRIINNADVNKMTVRNVGIVFSPTLNIPAPVFATFLQNYEPIFGIDPEEYELPSPVSETGSRFDTTPPRFDPPGRPSTSSGSASPHRQVRMESMRDHSRLTPTPPLLMNLNAARGSPTPSGTSRGSYEPAYLTHQGLGSAGGPRPAYEGGYVVSAGYEGHHQPLHRASPGFDRSHYASMSEDHNDGAVAHDQGHSSNAKRRESVIIMGGLVTPQQQGSKSRLREEAHY